MASKMAANGHVTIFIIIGSNESFIIGMKFFFLVFIDVLTPANHSQIK